MAQANQSTAPGWGTTPEFSIMPIKKPNPVVAPPGTNPNAPINPPSSNNGGMPLLQTSPQITNTAQSQTVTADAAQTGPAETVESRVARIGMEDSPLMQLAQTRATQQAAGRGLVNSSMAVGAAQDAVINAATPIASADASAINQNNQFNASAQQQTNLQNATQAQRTSELNAASKNKSAETNIENSMRANLANLDVSSRAFLADMEQKNKQLIQSSANAATLFNTYQQQVTAILTSDKLDQVGKERAIQNLQTMLQDGLAAQDAISGLDLAGILGIETAGTGETGTGTGSGTGTGEGAQQPSDAMTQWQSQVDALNAEIEKERNSPDGNTTRLTILQSQLARLMQQKPQ